MNTRSIASFTFSIIGFIFSLSFQTMVYEDENGTVLYEWYWAGAILSYLFSLVSIIFILTKNKDKKQNKLDSG